MGGRTAVWVLAILLLAAACAQDPAGDPSSSPQALVSPSIAASPATESEPDFPEPSVAPELVLGPDGLGLVSFGDSQQEVLQELADLLGPPDSSGPGCELRGPDVTTYNFRELSVTFDGDEFADYQVRVTPDEAQAYDLRTNHGIGLGSTVAELRQAYAADRIAIPGLPAEIFGDETFAISFPGRDGDLLGSLSGTSEDSVIVSFFTSVCD